MASFESINNTETFLTACANYLCSSNTRGDKKKKCPAFGFNSELCFTATVGERSSTDTAAEECLFAAVRSWVACRNYDTFLCHRLSRSQTHVDIHTLVPHVFIHSFIQRHRHTQLFLAIVFYPRQQNVAPLGS